MELPNGTNTSVAELRKRVSDVLCYDISKIDMLIDKEIVHMYGMALG